MSNLSVSQIERAICKVMGYEDFQHDVEHHEVTFKLNLELMEKYVDFKYLSGNMFTYALTNNELGDLVFDTPQAPNRPYQYLCSNPLDYMDKIVVSDDLAAFLHLNKVSVSNNSTQVIMPKLFESMEEFKKQEQAKTQALAKLRKEQKAAAKKAAKAAKKGNAPAQDSKAELPENTELEKASSESLKDRINAHVASYKSNLQENHRYQGRSIYIRMIGAKDDDFSSALMTLTIIHNQLQIVDDGITDVMRDVFVYEWFDKLADKSQFKEVADLDELYKALELSNVLIFPDGKSVLWYDIKGNILGDNFSGFGVDVDPPYLSGYAVGIKHVFLGHIEDHPTLKLYQTMLAHEGLNKVAKSVHYCPSDNISPFDAQETSEQMIFINNGYLIFDLELSKGDEEKPAKTIEVLVKESDNINFDELAQILANLKDNELSSFDVLCEDIINIIAQPIVDMKNKQEARRRARDPEYATYIFKDEVLSSNLNVPKLLRNYPLQVERLIKEDDGSLKLLILSRLFAFIDKDDNQFLENEESLGLVHADAIVVTLTREGDGLDVSSIDLADSVQVPYGSHNNNDVSSFKENKLLEVASCKDEGLPEGWDKEWQEALKDENYLETLNLKPQLSARDKTILDTRSRLRKSRKK